MNASASKIALGLACACTTALPPPSAVAYSPSTGATIGPGIFTLSAYGNFFTCSTTMSVLINGLGLANVSYVSFNLGGGGSAVCNYITVRNVPWSLSAASLVVPNKYAFYISGVDITVRQPSGTVVVRCQGNLNATLYQPPGTNPHQIVLSSQLTTVEPIYGQPCMLTSPPGTNLPTNLTAP